VIPQSANNRTTESRQIVSGYQQNMYFIKIQYFSTFTRDIILQSTETYWNIFTRIFTANHLCHDSRCCL